MARRKDDDTQEVTTAARYAVIQQGDAFVVADNETGGEVGRSGSQEGAEQLMADLEQRVAWAREAGTDNPAPVVPDNPVDAEIQQQQVEHVDPSSGESVQN